MLGPTRPGGGSGSSNGAQSTRRLGALVLGQHESSTRDLRGHKHTEKGVKGIVTLAYNDPTMTWPRIHFS